LKVLAGELMPKSNYGKWSVGSVLVMFALFFISAILKDQIISQSPTGDTIHTYFISRSILEIIIRGGFTAGISAFLNGMISIFDQKERGVLIYSSTIIGAAFTLFFIGQYLLSR